MKEKYCIYWPENVPIKLWMENFFSMRYKTLNSIQQYFKEPLGLPFSKFQHKLW